MSWIETLKSGIRQFAKLLLFRLLPLGLILFGAWYGFLKLVAKPPIDTTSALIMIWASVLLVVFAFFPQILERVKKIKLKDFEIELQEAVAKSAAEDFISISGLGDEFLFTEKGGWVNLQRIMEEASQQPNKSVLLAVNLRNDDHISIPMLFLYLFFLDLVSRNTVVIFFSSDFHPPRLSEINEESLIGAISGKRVLQIFLRRFPRFRRIFVIIGRPNPNYPEDFFYSRDRDAPIEESLRDWYVDLRGEFFESQSRSSEHLSRADVASWFKEDLSTKTITMNLSPADIETVRNALAKNDEFLLVLSGNHLDSIIESCQLANRFSRKVLSDTDKGS